MHACLDQFVYEGIKNDVQFSSISGGTDLNGCFAIGCTNLPGTLTVWRNIVLSIGILTNRTDCSL